MSDEIQSLPSYNIADSKSIAGTLNIYKDYLLNLIENSIPCVVQSYDSATNTVTVQPAINIPLSTGEYLQHSVIKVTAWKLCGGGFLINYPIKQGDTGWIIAADCDSSLFKQSKSISDPNTYQKHKYQFGYYLPDAIKDYNLSSDDKERLTLQNATGSEKISIGASDIKITSSHLVITANSVDINGDVNITGDMHSSNYDVHTHTSAAPGEPTSIPN